MHENGTRGGWVGTTASAIQGAIDSKFPAVSSSDISAISYFDASQLRYLDLSGGTYTSDSTLSLPHMFVLRLDRYDSSTGFVLQANPAKSTDSYPNMVTLDSVVTPKASDGLRYACSKEWRTAADNFLVRQLSGQSTVEQVPWGNVTAAHLAHARRSLAGFAAVLLTEHLDRAPVVLQHHLGWPMGKIDQGSEGSGSPSRSGARRVSLLPLEQEPELAADPGVLSLLRSHNRFDLELHQAAKGRWEADWLAAQDAGAAGVGGYT